MPGEYAFEIDSNVGRYWLAHGEGFDVVVERGRRLGVVENVVVNPITQEVSSVVVRRPMSAGVRRPAEVPIDELTAVLPASRRFLVTPDVPALKLHERRDRVRAALLRGRLRWWAFRSRAGRLARAKWPGARQRVTDGARWSAQTLATVAVLAARWTAHALVAVAVLTVALSEWSWRTGRERLRESELIARSRSRRLR